MTDTLEQGSAPLDSAVAAAADALLHGEAPEVNEETAPLVEVARQLNTYFAPREVPPEFQARLRREVETAWNERATKRKAPRRVHVLVWWAGAAAVLLLAFLLIPADATFPLSLSGAAASEQAAPLVDVPWRAVVLGVGLLGVAAFLWMRVRR